VLDLGIHLVDFLLRLGDVGSPTVIASQLFCGGVAWDDASDQVEDLAFVQLRMPAGAVARIACSWRLPAGCDAVIEATAYGSRAGVRAHNVGGSFYDFSAERLDRGGVHLLTAPPDDWGGRAVVAWAQRLAEGNRFDPHSDELVMLAGVIDDIYAVAAGRAVTPASSRSSVSTRWAAV
jgi:predicted dehydrogenase